MEHPIRLEAGDTLMTKARDWFRAKLKRLSIHIALFWMRHLPHPLDVYWLCWVLDHSSWFVVVRPTGSR